MARVRRVGIDPSRPESVVDQVNEIIFEVDGRVSFGEPLDPNDHDSFTLPGDMTAEPSHNGTLSNVEGSWVELNVENLDTQYDCVHNLYLEQPGGYTTEPLAGYPNVRWFVVGWQHDGSTRTLWEDFRVAGNAGRTGATNPPTFAVGATAPFDTIAIYWFANAIGANENQLYFTVQMPHGWKEGTTIHPHVHWVPNAAGAPTEDVNWGLEYSWANIGTTFPATTTISGNAHMPADGSLVASRHYFTDLGDITAAGQTVSSMIVCRLFRDSDGSLDTDGYTDDAGLLEIDFHYEVDGLGSDIETSKTTDLELEWSGVVSAVYNTADTGNITANSMPLRFYASPFLDVSQQAPLKVTLFFIKATH